MCVFVMLALPAKTDPKWAESVLSRHHQRFVPVRNNALYALTGNRFIFARTFDSGCDCHTPLGRALDMERQRARVEAEIEREAAKLRLIWSKEKFERWREDKIKKLEKVIVPHADTLGAADAWVSVLKDFLSDASLECVGIIYSLFDTSPEYQSIEIKGERKCDVGIIDRQAMLRLEPHVLHLFTAGHERGVGFKTKRMRK